MRNAPSSPDASAAGREGEDPRGIQGANEITAPAEPQPTSAGVSVVVPAYNRCDSLAECLESLARQTHPDYEIIVVDDGSTDETPRILDRFGGEHPNARFRWLRNPTNRGANVSRNRGIRAATGTHVAFTDSDCVAERDWLERLVLGFRNDRVSTVQGRIVTPPPTNIYELTYKGTNRVQGSTFAGRLVGCNMGGRRDILLKHPLDEDRKYGCDEEGLFLRLRFEGYEQRLVHDAVVTHNHRFTGRSFLRQAYAGGAAAGWFVYKYHLPPRLDMLPFLLAYITVPLGLLDARLAAVPALFFAAALAAITYNDLFRKGKTAWATVRSFPILLVSYHVRLAGYVLEQARLWFTRHNIQRVRLREKVSG